MNRPGWAGGVGICLSRGGDGERAAGSAAGRNSWCDAVWTIGLVNKWVVFLLGCAVVGEIRVDGEIGWGVGSGAEGWDVVGFSSRGGKGVAAAGGEGTVAVDLMGHNVGWCFV